MRSEEQMRKEMGRRGMAYKISVDAFKNQSVRDLLERVWYWGRSVQYWGMYVDGADVLRITTQVEDAGPAERGFVPLNAGLVLKEHFSEEDFFQAALILALDVEIHELGEHFQVENMVSSWQTWANPHRPEGRARLIKGLKAVIERLEEL